MSDSRHTSGLPPVNFPASAGPDRREADPTLWAAVDGLIDRAPSIDDLRSHRLHLLAVRRWRELGRDVGIELTMLELREIARTAATDALLDTLSGALNQPGIVLKGPAIAERYPERFHRPSSDLDLLVEDPRGAQARLIAAGFVPIGPHPESYYRGLHHERPLGLPGHPDTFVEVHSRCNWVPWARAPRYADLAPRALATRRDNILYPEPAAHAVIIAAHSWGTIPFRRLSDFLDIALMRSELQPSESEDVARRWGLLRLWRSMAAATDALFCGGPATVPLRTWARDIGQARDRTVLEGHLHRWLGPYWALPARRAVRETAIALGEDITPGPDEDWPSKLRRFGQALRAPLRPTTQHNELLGPAASRPRHRNREIEDDRRAGS